MSENASESPSAVTAQKGRAIVRLLTVLTCALIGYGVWYQLFRDEKLLDDWPRPERALTGEPRIPDEQNGLAQLLGAMDEMRLPILTLAQMDVLNQNKAWDPAVIRPLLEAAPGLRSRVEAALKLPDWQEGDEYDQQVSDLRLPECIEVLRARAMELEKAGQKGDSFEWYSQAHALIGRCVFRSRRIHHQMQVSSALRGLRRSLLNMAASSSLTREELSAVLRMIQSPSADFEELRLSVRLSEQDVAFELPSWETYRDLEPPAVEKLRELSATKLPVWFLSSRYKPGTTQKLLRSWMEELESIGFREGRENRNAVLAFQARIDSELKASPLSFDPNRAGRMLAASAFQRTLGLENGYFVVQEAERRCQAVVLAAKLYALDHGGARPDALDKLVPQYLEKIPLDPYDSQPVRWVPATGMAYVSGDDGQDDIPKLSPKTFSSPDPKGAWAQLP